MNKEYIKVKEVLKNFNKEDESVNVLIGQETMTLKQNEDLILYLLKKFNK